jgi:ATP-dependent RNA helicase DeaD
VTPREIVGAIANEAGIEGRYIGRIDIRSDHSTVDLPDGMPKEIFNHLKRVYVRGQALRITTLGKGGDSGPPRRFKAPEAKGPLFQPKGASPNQQGRGAAQDQPSGRFQERGRGEPERGSNDRFRGGPDRGTRAAPGVGARRGPKDRDR